MTWQVWLAYVALEFALCVTPGPAVLFVAAQALAGGVGRSLGAAAAILVGNGFYYVLSATGLGALLLASYELFFAVKWLGAAYLVFLGLRAILSRRAEGAPPATQRPRRVFLSALGVQLANPKATLFVIAILPQFIDPAAPVAPQMALLGLTMAVIEFGVLMGYALAASRTARFVIAPRFAGITDKIAGAVLIAAGAGLAMVRRSG